MNALERAMSPFPGLSKQVFSSTDALRRSAHREGDDEWDFFAPDCLLIVALKGVSQIIHTLY